MEDLITKITDNDVGYLEIPVFFAFINLHILA